PGTSETRHLPWIVATTPHLGATASEEFSELSGACPSSWAPEQVTERLPREGGKGTLLSVAVCFRAHFTHQLSKAFLLDDAIELAPVVHHHAGAFRHDIEDAPLAAHL